MKYTAMTSTILVLRYDGSKPTHESKTGLEMGSIAGVFYLSTLGIRVSPFSSLVESTLVKINRKT